MTTTTDRTIYRITKGALAGYTCVVERVDGDHVVVRLDRTDEEAIVPARWLAVVG